MKNSNSSRGDHAAQANSGAGEIIIIGAGPAGLACAVSLVDLGYSVRVIESGSAVGGLARSFELWGQIVDVGPHRFFSHDKLVNDFWLRFVQSDYTLVSRLTRIFYRNKFFYYPLQPLNAFVNLGPVATVLSVLSYARSRLMPIRDAKSFDQWVSNRFGRRLFSIFFKTYTEKVWGVPCAMIDADWAAQRIKKLSLWEVVKNAFFKKGASKHKTLVDQFAYPRGGSGIVYERMAEYLRSKGASVMLGVAVSRIRQNAEGRAVGVELSTGEELGAACVVSTMPLTQMVCGLKTAPAVVRDACASLYYRNTILVYLEVEGDGLFPDQWVYVHSPEVRHGRITNFRNWCRSLVGDSRNTILCMEFWCFDSDPIWAQSDAEIGAVGVDEVYRTGLVPKSRRICNHHVMRISKSYPVYQTGYRGALSLVENYVDSVPGLYAIGRYGAFKYNNQDHSILMGLLAGGKINGREGVDLWAINTDSEYQEDSKISDSGLKKDIQ